MADTETQAMEELGTAAGLAGDALEEFIHHWRQATEALTASPAEELKWRLNQRLQGEDPGQPVNWRGL